MVLNPHLFHGAIPRYALLAEPFGAHNIWEHTMKLSSQFAAALLSFAVFTFRQPHKN
jgi:hypothetical protein